MSELLEGFNWCGSSQSVDVKEIFFLPPSLFSFFILFFHFIHLCLVPSFHFSVICGGIGCDSPIEEPVKVMFVPLQRTSEDLPLEQSLIPFKARLLKPWVSSSRIDETMQCTKEYDKFNSIKRKAHRHRLHQACLNTLL